MTIYEWTVSRLKASTSIVSLVSSNIFPDYIPSTSIYNSNGIIYQDIGDKINRKLRQNTISLRSFAGSKAQCETINSIVYNLFDSSTAYIQSKSSSLCVDSVQIITNAASGFDDNTHLWYRALDVRITWHLST